jgi:hypothetical protein
VINNSHAVRAIDCLAWRCVNGWRFAALTDRFTFVGDAAERAAVADCIASMSDYSGSFQMLSWVATPKMIR